MLKKSIFDLVCQALPRDIKPADLRALCDERLFADDAQSATETALRRCARINWQAYLENNPDVKAAGVDPVVHFLQNGIHEGRLLQSWSPYHVTAENDAKRPKVTVIVPNYNNSLFLNKCLNSLIHQTLRAIEIIVVDDASTDNSLEIISHFASFDERVNAIRHTWNQGSHMARKSGVAAARGDYIMFVDADDYFTTDACEQAYKLIIEGYDIVAFDCNQVYHGPYPGQRVTDRNFWSGKLANGRYEWDEKLNLPFKDMRLPCFIGGKIYERGFAQFCFRQMAEFRCTFLEDMYEFLILNYYSRNLYKSDAILFTYAQHTGISTSDTSRYIKTHLVENLEMPKYFEYFCKEHQLDSIWDYFRGYYFKIMLKAVDDLDEITTNIYFDKMAETFGVLFCVQSFMTFYNCKWKKITNKFAMYKPKRCPEARAKRIIGIFYHRIGIGGVEKTIQSMARVLTRAGYEVCVFLEEKSKYDLDLEPGTRKFYLETSLGTLVRARQHVADLHDALRISGVDTMIFMAGANQILTWDMMLMHLMGISVIGAVRLDINMEMLARGRNYQHSALLQTLRCLEKVICTNVSSEIYLRAQGINAQFIPNSVNIANGDPGKHARMDNVIVVARLGDGLKRIFHCLNVHAEIAKRIPGARMIFTGDFDNEDLRNKFLVRAREIGISDSIRITDRVKTVYPYLLSAKVLFSASYMEGFPNNIAEAQACGLPVVMYDLDIDMAQDNESIIMVEQNDYKKAAEVIARLLRDDAERERLAAIAMAHAGHYDDKLLRDNLIDVIENHDKYARIRYYTSTQYRSAIRYMSRYAGKQIPPADAVA